MWYLWRFRCLLLHFIVGEVCLPSARAIWPSGDSSTIQLLGLFKDAMNTSEPTTLSVHARAMFKAAVLLSHEYKITVEGQLIGWQTAQTGGNVISALRNSCIAVSASNIVGIVGPNLSRESTIIAPFGKTIGIPVVSYAATDPDLSDRNIYSNFYRTVPSDNMAAIAIVQLFLRYNWTSCIIIYQNDVFGLGGVKAISEEFRKNNLIVEESIPFDIITRSIRGDLKKLLTNSRTRIIVLWAETTYARLVLQAVLDNDLIGPQFTCISSSSIPLDSFNQTVHDKLIGMLTIEPVAANIVNGSINTTLLNAAYNIWQQYEPESFPGAMNVNYYALFAFDATWLLIQSLQQYCSTIKNISSSCTSNSNASFCFDRRFLYSSSFINTISRTTFLGISGLVQFNINGTDRVNGAYYYAQNVQPSTNGLEYVPVLVWSDLNDWTTYGRSNVIVWPGNSFKCPESHAKLSGVSLKIALSESTPFTRIINRTNQFGQNITEFIGYLPDLIDLLKGKMGFIPELVLKPPDMTLPKCMEAVANGVYDMLVADITITATRREIADFSSAIFDTALRIVIRKKTDASVDLLSFLKPFTPNLWLLILAASVYSAILIFLYERQENVALRNKSISSSAAMSGWYSVGTIMGYGADFQVRTAAGRLLTTSLYILSLILVATYTANLASNLTILKSKHIISGIDDIKNGKIPFNRIGIRVDTVSEDFYLREISGGIRNFYPLKSRQELFDGLFSGVLDVAFMDNGVAEYLTKSLYCNLTLVGAPFDSGAFGIVSPKQWLYGEELDINILLLKESGVLDELKKKWFSIDICPATSDISTSMGIDGVSGLFLTFAVISILSSLLFVWRNRYKILLTQTNVFTINRATKPLKRTFQRHNILL